MKRFVEYLEARFGIPASLFDRFNWCQESGGRIYLVPGDIPASSKRVAAGLWAGRIDGDMTATSEILQLFGGHATRNRLTLTRDQARRYLSGENLALQEPQGEGLSEGCVALFFDNIPLGAGALKKNALKNTLQRAKRTHVEYL